MSATRRGRATHEAAQDAFTTLEQYISQESDALNLLDFIIHINTLIELLEEQIGKMDKRLDIQ